MSRDPARGLQPPGMLRDLRYFWRTSLAVAAGAAVACAVLTGALLVGDSVRGSLRQLTLERLGGVDLAVAGQRFVDAEIARTLAAHDEVEPRVSRLAPAILLRAAVRHAERGTRAAGVGLQGVDQRFVELVGGPSAAPLFPPTDSPAVFPPAVINQGLADALDAAVGDAVLIDLERWTEVPTGSLLSREETADVVETVRVEVTRILPDEGLGVFGLEPRQTTPHVLYVPLAELQRALDQDGKVNSLLATRRSDDSAPSVAIASLEQARADAAAFTAALGDLMTLDDYSVTVRPLDGVLLVESQEYVLRPALAAAVRATADATGAVVLPHLTYLANAIEPIDVAVPDSAVSRSSVPYSTIAALDPPADPRFGRLVSALDETPIEALEPSQILLNAWTAERLAPDPSKLLGERVRLRYFVVGPREELSESSSEFEIAGIVGLESLGADPDLTQEYPGIAGSDDMSSWDPPFPFDLQQIDEDDEEYWDTYRGTPKAFVALEQGQELWRTRWGGLTGVRVAPPAGEDLKAFQARFDTALRSRLDPAAFGLQPQPVKALGLGASSGSTDFGGLFIGLSWFVIASAALLVALLFRLAVERRASEIGLRLALGFRPRAVRRRLIAEGGLLAASGALVGLAGAVGYAAAMMHGLRTWWRPAVGTSRLELFVAPASLVGGYLLSVLVVLAVIWWTARGIGKVPAPRLLRGEVDSTRATRGRRALPLAALMLTVALGAVAWGVATGRGSDPAVFWLAGPCLLVGLLALFAVVIDRPLDRLLGGFDRPGAGALARMAIVNSRRHRARSLAAASLVAVASFVIVTVAAYQLEVESDDLGLDSGAGGYDLVVEAEVPLRADLADPDDRFDLGVPDEAEPLLASSTIMPFRLVPGDDTSCLNLYQPTEPRLLGVPPEQVARGGFTFRQVWDGAAEALGVDAIDDPWSLLGADLGPNVVAVIGDGDSTQWILKLPLGEDLVLENEAGEELRLRLIANLATSIFQSELLMAESDLLEHFPSRGGHPYFLVDTPDGAARGEVAAALESTLTPYGVDAVEAADKLASFHAVQNTYLSTFRSLGGLGLLLGTLGLAIVLIRNVLERRKELAALRAFGFRRRQLLWLVVGENATLLVVGLAVGTLAALVTAGGHLLSPSAHVPWAPLLGTLLVILVVGLAACWAAARGALAAPLLPALKSEG
ncbi:MAG: FtsX-like permease family protein [Acidobacteriota bacterium]